MEATHPKTSLMVPEYDGKLFTWIGTEGSIEASDLPKCFDCRLWPDSCDVGFKVKSHRTGKVALFIQSHNVTNDDNELLFTIYEMHGRPEVVIRVFND